MANEHEGHRDRLKNRFIAEGLDHFEAHNVLELLLFYTIPRRDTNELAHILLRKFGSLVGVLNASPEELTEVEGITMNTAVHLHLIADLSRRYHAEALAAPPAEADAPDKMRYLGRKLVAMCAGLTEENLFVICLDNSLRVLCCERLSSGTPDSIQLVTRQIVELAIKYHAPSVIIAHNHPGGIAIPSRNDVSSTLSLRKSLSAISISLLDHFVVAGDDYVSMAQSGFFSQCFQLTGAEKLSCEDILEDTIPLGG